MSEAAAEGTSTETSAQGQAAESTTTETEQVADSTDWKAEARKWEQRAKDNGAKASEFDKQRKAAMTDADRAIEEAKQAARSEATTAFGQRLAHTEFDNLAGRRNPDFDTASALEFVDLKKFLDDDGEPDVKAIRAAVERLVPEPAGGSPTFDGGVRTTTKATDFNQELRRAAGRA